MFELSNTGGVDLVFGRGANGTDMGTPVLVLGGQTVTKSAAELGASPNHFLNVQNGNPTDGNYKVVRS